MDALLATIRLVEGELAPPDPDSEPWKDWRERGHKPEFINLEYVHRHKSVQWVEPDACGPDTDCHQVRRAVAWMAEKRRDNDRKHRDVVQYTRSQLQYILRNGYSSLPPREQLENLALRVDVQRAVDSIPHVGPQLVWRILQGESTRQLAENMPVDQSTVVRWLQRAWSHCRERLADYGTTRRHWGQPCAG
jgi:hypothetical protein